ncbi:insulinase family protein [Oceanicaulis sp. AH-315-P02]|nr:insulinase family protein [Robiginitomaculum sp.]MBN4047729.1 insulinase family protein [Oceanicaulis sp. AH-315-P02]
MSISRSVFITIGVVFALGACSAEDLSSKQPAAPKGQIKQIEFVKYELENGLDVILHVDRSDPIVAIDLTAHVGSAREIAGRTGFAHLFEHLLFLDSENLGYGGLDTMNTRIGGEGTNGYTTNDVTKYFQAVPSDALEKVIWAEADKLGWFINTVTSGVLDNERQVVKNEKRQRVDNQPFGQNWGLIGKTIYPADHPYSWQVIGSLADLDAASIDDVKSFYRRWYVPNNVTLTITGDFDVDQAEVWVEKYFGEIPRGEDIAPLSARPGKLDKTVNLKVADNFATVPQLTLTWPSIEQYHPDAYALDILATYLSEGKLAPLNEVLIDEEKLSTTVASFTNSSELAGEFYLLVRANAGQNLSAVKDALDKGLQRFEENGISKKDLNKIKAGLEVDFYGNIQSVLGKAIQLGEYNTYTNDPGFIHQDIANIQAITTDDVMRVYNKYIKDKNYVATSFVPKDEIDLALSGAVLTSFAEEEIVKGAEAQTDFDPTARTFTPTPSAFDRTIEPEFGGAITMRTPTVWRGETKNGIKLFGIENDETPLIYFSLKIDAGDIRGSLEQPAISTLTAALLNKGTINKTTAELEDAIQLLGSSISISTTQSGAYLRGSTLARNFNETMLLAEEMLLQPRWDSEEFATLMLEAANIIDQEAANPSAIVAKEFQAIMYPSDNIYSVYGYGSKDKLQTVTLDDLKTFYATYYTPAKAQFLIVGDISAIKVKAALTGIGQNWSGDANPKLELSQAIAPTKSTIYFYDIPGAKQSSFQFGYPAMAIIDPDFVKTNAMNYLLGNIYTSKLNTELRVNKGYTYGIRSSFAAVKDRGTFSVRTSVRSNVTYESAQLIRDILAEYGTNFTAEDLKTMKSAIIKGQALKSETLSAKLGILGQISNYGFSDDYRLQDAAKIEAMTLDDIKRLSEKHLTPDAMHLVIAGDAKTQLESLKQLGFGEPILLNKTVVE